MYRNYTGVMALIRKTAERRMIPLVKKIRKSSTLVSRSFVGGLSWLERVYQGSIMGQLFPYFADMAHSPALYRSQSD